jgi:hypothetical protein
MEDSPDIDLYELGQNHFTRFLAEFAAYGIEADPGLEMRPGSGMLCYYSLEDRHIYLSVPDLKTPVGRLQALFFRSLLGCETNDELIYFFRLFLPHIISHELAHHFRQRYGLFGDSLWHEEQVANKLAVAVVKHRLSPSDKTKARNFLRRAIDTLAQQMEEKNIAVDSYYSVLHAMNVAGQIDVSEFENVEMLITSLGISEETVLEGSGQVSADFLQRMSQRDELIGKIDEQYASDQIKYIYYHLGWLYLDLMSRETEYIDEFARDYLNLAVQLLPPIPVLAEVTNRQIMACYLAYRQIADKSEVAARYFYKRYRSLLLTRVEQVELHAPGQTERLKREARLLLENWNEEQADTLDYLSHLAPLELRPLFPHLIMENSDIVVELPADLPTETDQRLWSHIFANVDDLAAANTLQRLAMLDLTDIYRPLPSGLMLNLASKFNVVRLATGEPVIWEGEYHDDVYFLLDGRLEVVVTVKGQPTVVSEISSGEMFGEIAFFTDDARSATVRATEPSRCFVLTDADLQLMAYNHPTILMRMASALAKRLVNVYARNRNETV